MLLSSPPTRVFIIAAHAYMHNKCDETAHCQPGFLASLVAVFGEYDISGDLESKRSVTKNVKRVIVHRQYDAATFENDLAILELESPVRYDTHIGK
jgi:secreted trypsin-like serine protease